MQLAASYDECCINIGCQPVVIPSLQSPVRAHLRTGVDIVQIARIEESLQSFGHRFATRLFTAAEIEYSSQERALAPQRFAEVIFGRGIDLHRFQQNVVLHVLERLAEFFEFQLLDGLTHGGLVSR